MAFWGHTEIWEIALNSCDGKAPGRGTTSCFNLVQGHACEGAIVQDLDIDDVDGCAAACKANDRCDCISMHANTWGAGKCRLEASGGGGHTDRNVALYSAMTMDEYDGCQTDGTVPSFEYENTVGYCRGGPAWEAPHAGAGQLWDCSPTGGMNGPNDDGMSGEYSNGLPQPSRHAVV